MQNKTIAVMGAGSFGTAIAWMLRESGINVRMWAFKEEEARAINETHHNAVLLPECDLIGVYATHQVADAVSGADGVIVVTPSFGVRGVLQQMAGCVADDTPVLLLSKGLDPESGETFVKVACNILGGEERIAVLAGPNHAEELSKGNIAGAVVACKNQEVAKFFQHAISNSFFRLYISDDPTGVSLCAASKNVIAIACGIARGLGLGDNAVALLMTRGLREICRLVTACGGTMDTCLGLAGVGDLDVTCNSTHSRNSSYGVAFAQEGIGVAEYEERRHMVVEGAHAVGPLLKLAAEHNIEMPIMEAVQKLLTGGKNVDETIVELMTRPLVQEGH